MYDCTERANCGAVEGENHPNAQTTYLLEHFQIAHDPLKPLGMLKYFTAVSALWHHNCMHFTDNSWRTTAFYLLVVVFVLFALALTVC